MKGEVFSVIEVLVIIIKSLIRIVTLIFSHFLILSFYCIMSVDRS